MSSAASEGVVRLDKKNIENQSPPRPSGFKDWRSLVGLQVLHFHCHSKTRNCLMHVIC